MMIEAVFTPLPGFIHGSISSLAGILVKEDEVKRGVSLARTGTATGANTFRVPLAQGDFEKAQNLRMLRDNPWISLAIVFSDGRRAVIALKIVRGGVVEIVGAIGVTAVSGIVIGGVVIAVVAIVIAVTIVIGAVVVVAVPSGVPIKIIVVVDYGSTAPVGVP